MKKDFRLTLEKLDSRLTLSINPWYIDAIKAPVIWDQLNDTNKSVVAVIDSGIDFNHEALKPNIWTNPLEKADGIDNDNNGYIDDIHGWDFVENDNIPQGAFFHGTHVAGIINTIGNNHVSIMPLRYSNDSGMGYAGAIVSAINYAVDMKSKGVDIAAINCSFGGLTYDPTSIRGAVQRASDNGIVVVLAAGNNGVDMDVTPIYPGSYNYANTITVAAINADKSLAGYSNYGKNSVAVAAPGSEIFSTLPNNSYGYISGTSMAAPMVTGAIGLLKSIGNYGASALKYAITKGSEILTNLSDKITFGVLDLSQSSAIIRTQPTQQPIKLTPIVVQPPLVKKLEFRFDYITNRGVKGWTHITNSSIKPIVSIYINGILKYQVNANLYRNDTQRYDGFNISINRRFLAKRSNLIEIRIKDPFDQLESIAFKGYVKK